MARALITMLAISFAATVVAQEKNAAAEKEISALMHEYFGANAAEFVKASERLFHEKYQFVDSNGQRVSRTESIARINRADSSRPPSTATLSEESISVTGNTAVAIYKMSVQWVPVMERTSAASLCGSKRAAAGSCSPARIPGFRNDEADRSLCVAQLRPRAATGATAHSRATLSLR